MNMKKRFEKRILNNALGTDGFLEKKSRKSLLIMNSLYYVALLGVIIVYALVIKDEIHITRAYFAAFLLGAFISFSLLYMSNVKQALILKKYVSWDKEAIQNRLNEINS